MAIRVALIHLPGQVVEHARKMIVQLSGRHPSLGTLLRARLRVGFPRVGFPIDIPPVFVYRMQGLGRTLPPFLPGKSHTIPLMEEEMSIFKSFIPYQGMGEGAGSSGEGTEVRRVRGLRHRRQAGGVQ